jgi:hypothetical protein
MKRLSDRLNHKLVYIILLVALWLLPLSWIIPTYLITVPVPCRPNLPAWWACFGLGYIGPMSCAVIPIAVIIFTVLLARHIAITKW